MRRRSNNIICLKGEKNMKRKRMSALVMALILAVSAAASGCSKEPEAQSAASQAGSQAEETASSGGEEQSSEPVTLKFLGINQGFDPTSDPIGDLFQEKTGYKVEFYMLPVENAAEKLNMDLASNVEYDIVNISRTWFDGLLENNALQPIGGIIEENGPNIQAAIPDELWQVSTSDGEIYGIPKRSPMDTIGDAIGIRKDILDQLGLPVPTTLDEFYETLKTIKEETGLVPLTTSSGWVPTIASAFGLSTYWMEVDGELLPRVEHPQYRAYVAFMIKLYSEGLLDSEMPVNKSENVDSKFTSGKAAAASYGWGNAANIIPALEKNVPEGEIAIVQPLKGENGEQAISLNRGIDAVAAVPKSSKKAADAIRYINNCLEPDVYLELTLGTEGVNFEIKDGSYYPIFPAFNDFANANWYMAGSIVEDYDDYWQARVRKNEYMASTFEEMMQSADVGVIDPMALAPTMPNNAKYRLALENLESDFLKKATGSADIGEYDAFLAEWEAQGGSDMIAEANEWYSGK